MMKMMTTKRRFCILLAALTCFLTAGAQPPRRGEFDMKEFKARLEAEITKYAQLTPEESQKFFPLYFEMKEKQHGLQVEMFKLKREMKKAVNPSDDTYAKTIQKIKKLNVEIAELEAEYFKKICKAVPARKVYQVIQAEDEFHRKMLSKFNQERKRK